MIRISKNKKILLLEYTPEINRPDWIRETLDKSGKVIIAKTFHFQKSDLVSDKSIVAQEDNLISDENDVYYFVLGTIEGEYYKVRADILGIKFDLFLSTQMKIADKTFRATRDISIFRKIDQLIKEQIFVGGQKENAIPISDFEILLKNFPTTTELNYYASSRVSKILGEYLGTMTNAQETLQKYLKKRRATKAVRAETEIHTLYEYEIEKYVYVRERIKEMLKKSDAYGEDEWRDLMVDFLLLIFPKYVSVLKNVRVKDYAKPKPTNRYVDLTLVDAKGNLDIIEIKQPFNNCLLSSSKYRNNYTPKKELSGAIMQAEKYLFHLNKWGIEGEKEFNKKYAIELPADLKIKILNPKAIIILGRDEDFDTDQEFDFEIIRRKYANMLDIITYDDLLKRLENIIEKCKRR